MGWNRKNAKRVSNRVGFFVGDKLVKKQAIPAPTVAASFPHLS